MASWNDRSLGQKDKTFTQSRHLQAWLLRSQIQIHHQSSYETNWVTKNVSREGREGGFLTFFPWKERISESEPSKRRVRSENWLYVQGKFELSIFKFLSVYVTFIHQSRDRQGLACEVRKVFKLANSQKFKLAVSVSKETKLPPTSLKVKCSNSSIL